MGSFTELKQICSHCNKQFTKLTSWIDPKRYSKPITAAFFCNLCNGPIACRYTCTQDNQAEFIDFILIRPIEIYSPKKMLHHSPVKKGKKDEKADWLSDESES